MKSKFTIISLLLLTLTSTIHACLLPEEIKAEGHLQRRLAPKVESLKKRETPQRTKGIQMPVAAVDGDRFQDGKAPPPTGMGIQFRGLGWILNVKEVSSVLKSMANEYPTVKLLTGISETHYKRNVSGIAIGDSPKAFIQAGVHARERGGPDHVIYFLADLLKANKTGIGLSYGKRNYTHEQVQKVLSAGVVAIPMVNPDGVAYDQKTNTCWRKNRALSPIPDDTGTGVDISRNFDAMWDFDRIFNLSVEDTAFVASTRPSSQLYHGPAPFSEPETQNIVHLLNQYDNITWFVDLHSPGPYVLYGWSDDDTQTTKPEQNFANATFDGMRGVINSTHRTHHHYQEYMEEKHLQTQILAAQRIAGAINDGNIGEIRYKVQQSADAYPMSGTSTDYCLSKYYSRKCDARLIHGLTIQFGLANDFECPFYPYLWQYHQTVAQVGAGLMEFLLTAAGEDGEVKRWQC